MGGTGQLAASAGATVAPAAGTDRLGPAVLATLAYADLFDHPLTPGELHRYLLGVAIGQAELARALERDDRLRAAIGERDGYVFLAGRDELVAIRRRRAATATRLWPAAIAACRRIGGRPFVRAVAVTGALAVDSVEAGADIDLLVVARAGRVWTCRAFVVAHARSASRHGPRLCPNYVLSEAGLAVAERNAYVARELAQLVPVVGPETCARLRAANAWSASLLPNAAGAPTTDRVIGARPGRSAVALERLLAGRLGDAVERLAARGQTARLAGKIARAELGGAEVAFTADAYKGHFDGHGGRVLAAWKARLASLGVDPP